MPSSALGVAPGDWAATAGTTVLPLGMGVEWQALSKRPAIKAMAPSRTRPELDLPFLNSVSKREDGTVPRSLMDSTCIEHTP